MVKIGARYGQIQHEREKEISMASKKGTALKKGKKLRASKSLRKTELSRAELKRADLMRDVTLARAGGASDA
jgi:hypothetical protein